MVDEERGSSRRHKIERPPPAKWEKVFVFNVSKGILSTSLFYSMCFFFHPPLWGLWPFEKRAGNRYLRIRTNDFGILWEVLVKHPKTSVPKHQAFRPTTGISSTSRCMITGLASPTFVANISAPQQTAMTPKRWRSQRLEFLQPKMRRREKWHGRRNAHPRFRSAKKTILSGWYLDLIYIRGRLKLIETNFHFGNRRSYLAEWHAVAGQL
jgi:hypothetical protein